MRLHPLRRGQVIAPFGVGAMNTYPDGVSLMVAGLDGWFPKDLDIDVEEFKVVEPRLARTLRVDHFRLPPDYRERDGESRNTGIRLPGVRFPRAHTCSWCDTLDMKPLSHDASRIDCPVCAEKNKYGRLSQVQIVVACTAGHIQDFPWREWCHASFAPRCEGRLKVSTSGTTATLASTRVQCECDASRSLADATGPGSVGRGESGDQPGSDDTELSALSANLSAEAHYLCRGARPWLGDAVGDGDCRRSLHVTLRSAVNTYFADVRSAIFVPAAPSTVPPELLLVLRNEPARTSLRTIVEMGAPLVPSTIRRVTGNLLTPFDDADIAEAADLVVRELGLGAETTAPDEDDADVDEQAFRLAEAQAMLIERTDPDLIVRRMAATGLDAPFSELLTGVSLVDRLRVTKAFLGFSRLGGTDDELIGARRVRRDLLWREYPGNWLPAALVFGEGILLEFDATRMSEWAQRPEVIARRDRLMDRYLGNGGRRSVVVEEVTPEYVALHTLAHLAVLELAFLSGYSATSMSERVYVDRQSGTFAVLLYTAAGDSEGTMGGLVRLGRHDRLGPILSRTVERAEWCSIDPVCSELGDQYGQGPNGCNLAACYACGVVPETTCDDFNRFLDREMLSGPGLGLLVRSE